MTIFLNGLVFQLSHILAPISRTNFHFKNRFFKYCKFYSFDLSFILIAQSISNFVLLLSFNIITFLLIKYFLQTRFFDFLYSRFPLGYNYFLF